MELANTGFGAIREYISALRRYKSAFSDYTAARRFEAKTTLVKALNLPPFSFRWPLLRTTLDAITFDVSLLVTYAALLSFVGYIRFQTYDVR
jgi:hypothetical protein